MSGDVSLLNSASIDWRLTYNTIDLEAGRKFAIGESAWIRPSLGIKTAIIQQRIQLDTSDVLYGTSTEEDITHDFWGIGPSFGIGGAWNLPTCDNLSLIGSFSADFLFGQWNVNDAYANRQPDAAESVRRVCDQLERFVSWRSDVEIFCRPRMGSSGECHDHRASRV